MNEIVFMSLSLYRHSNLRRMK